MSIFATLNPEQLGRVQRARNAVSPFDLGACLPAAFEALKRDFWNIVLVNFLWMLLSCFIVTIPPLTVGICRFNDKAIRGEPAKLDDLFSGFQDFGSSWLMLLVMIPFLIVAFVLCYLPGIYLSIAWMLAWNLLADKRGSFWECLEMSRQAITAHWGWAFLLVIVAQIVSQVGLIACLVGVFATIPLYTLMLSAAYRRLFAEPVAPQL
jgi:ABC-type sugar transport system permease subunit